MLPHMLKLRPPQCPANHNFFKKQNANSALIFNTLQSLWQFMVPIKGKPNLFSNVKRFSLLIVDKT